VTLSTHVLDATTGRPAAGLHVRLEHRGHDGWSPACEGLTGADGRLRLPGTAASPEPEPGPGAGPGFEPGVYRITFGSGPYFPARGTASFYPEVTDRILATAVKARWRHASPVTQEPGSEGALGSAPDWADSYCAARDLLLAAFAEPHSYSLQRTLFAMGRRVLEGRPEIAEIRLSLPNKHHFEVDMSPFGLENAGEVFYAADRPYGLIEGTAARDEAPPPEKAW
jgi:5-hydroxyisourate hydrolase-like protein (transthyretin family)